MLPYHFTLYIIILVATTQISIGTYIFVIRSSTKNIVNYFNYSSSSSSWSPSWGVANRWRVSPAADSPRGLRSRWAVKRARQWCMLRLINRSRRIVSFPSSNTPPPPIIVPVPVFTTSSLFLCVCARFITKDERTPIDARKS